MMKFLNTYKSVRKFVLVAFSLILFNQLIISCNSSKNMPCPTFRDRQKVKLKKYHSHNFLIFSSRGKKKKSKYIPPAKNKSARYSYIFSDIHTREGDLFTHSGTDIVLPAYIVHDSPKLGYLKPQAEFETEQIERSARQVKWGKNGYLNYNGKANSIIASDEFGKGHRKSKKNVTALFGLFASLFSLVAFGVFRANPSLGKRVSRWAKNHPKSAILFINLAQLAIIGGGLLIGKNIHDLGFNVSNASTNVLLGFGGLALLIYPLKKLKAKTFAGGYMRRKSHDLSLVLCGFLLMTNIGIRAADGANFSKPVTTAYQVVDQNHLSDGSLIQKGSDAGLSRHQEKPSQVETIGSILLTILSLVLFAGLLYLVAWASCSLACNGFVLLSYIVLIGGAAAVIVLLILALKAIWKGNKVQYQQRNF